MSIGGTAAAAQGEASSKMTEPTREDFMRALRSIEAFE
jgi:hypothetical protein